MRAVLSKLTKDGRSDTASRGEFKELCGIVLELENPRARLSVSEQRGTVFSCLGEFLWYLSGSSNGQFISYYISAYRDEAAENLEIKGAYGPRIFGHTGTYGQFHQIVELLKRKRTSRQAVIQIFDAEDLESEIKDVPCTCTLQFLIRDGALHTIAHLRSNDAYKGLPHDIFCFTLIQEIMACELNVDLGSYRHMVGSLHYYLADLPKIRQFLAEGWQDKADMPQIPKNSVTESLTRLLELEEHIRMEHNVELDLHGLEPYWLDLVTLLQAYRLVKSQDPGKLDKYKDLSSRLVYDVYKQYIEKRIDTLRN
jgi:thymidylate synthase